MPVKDTSRVAYRELTPQLNRLETQVLKTIYRNSRSCDREIHTRTGLEISSAVARRNKLSSLGYIRLDGTKKSTTGKTVQAWTITQKGIDYLTLQRQRRLNQYD